jgi:D-3-phosphoglycerate dehydrogenase
MVHPLAGEVLAHDPYATTIPRQVTRVGELDELLRRSDVLSVHVPLTAQTRGLIGHRELSLLPAGAVVVNVSRGGIVDEPALAGLLGTGHLGGAGLDVFTAEPLPATSPLLSAPNTILTPHCAAISDRAMWRLASWTLGDVLSWLSAGKVLHGNVVVAGSR